MTHNLSVNLVEQDGNIHTATLPYELLLNDQNKLEIMATPYRVACGKAFLSIIIDNFRSHTQWDSLEKGDF